MDYKEIKIPFLDNASIKKQADLFREKFWDSSLPVEVEEIVDLKMKMDVIPLKDLMKLCNGDAFITSNWKSIYVDAEKYLDERYKNRLRFSFAHEIGHFVLHKSIYKHFNIKEFTDFYSLIGEIPQQQYGYLELQASKFASYLLIPREALIVKREEIMKDKSSDLGKIDVKALNSYLAIPLSNYFCVSEEAIEIALGEIMR